MCVLCVQRLTEELNIDKIHHHTISEDQEEQLEEHIPIPILENFIKRNKKMIHAIETELEAVVAAAAEKEGK